jgi:hypothetical protein
MSCVSLKDPVTLSHLSGKTLRDLVAGTIDLGLFVLLLKLH